MAAATTHPVTVVGALAVVVLLAASQASSGPETGLGVVDADLEYYLSTADEGEVMLLEPEGIANDPQWRDHFSDQVFGHGIRTEPRSLAAEDVALVTRLLLEESSWNPGKKRCVVNGDAVLVLSGPHGQVTIMLELWCARAWLRSNTLRCHQADGNVDQINEQLRGLVGKYFADDVYLRELGSR